MGVLLENFWIEAALGLLAFFAIFYYSWTAKYNYWKDLNVPYIEPKFPFGNTKEFLLAQKFIGYVFRDLYFQLKGMYEMNNFYPYLPLMSLFRILLCKNTHK